MNVAIALLILTGLAVHRYLSTFWEQGLLPYSHGFTLFANLFALTYAVALVWMLGIVPGIVAALLCYFQIVYTAGLWVFLVPFARKVQRSPDLPVVNEFIYGGFSYLVGVLGILVIVNFFVSDYRALWKTLGPDYFTVALVFAGVVATGKIAAVAVERKVPRG